MTNTTKKKENLPHENITIINQDFLQKALVEGFTDLHFKVDNTLGMIAIVAIHSTKLGPALGGCRFIEYANTESAIYDAMRLAKGMSYKAALANLPLGGGKAVIIKPHSSHDRTSIFHLFGEFIESLGGRYITALDSGSELSDMDIIAEHTAFVASRSSDNGNPAPFTADGVLRGIQAAVLFKLGLDNLKGLHIVIQGLGHVGVLLAAKLSALGVKLTVTDINPQNVQRVITEFGAKTAAPDDIYKIPCDVFAPCALGGIINSQTINQFQTSIIAGAANNQLEKTLHGEELYHKNILYAPDYLINAGGLIFASSKYFATSQQLVKNQIDGIYTSLMNIFKQSKQKNLSTSAIADSLAEEKLK